MKVKANKYGAGKYKIIVNDDAERITTGCCCCYLDIRSVTATMPWYGYNEFECEGLEPTNKKYLGFQASGKGKIAWCGNFFAQEPVGIWSDVEQSWDIDPFTGDVCYTGEKASRILRPCNTLESCTENSKVYNCGTIPAGGNCPEQELVWQETLYSPYELTDLKQKVNEMFSRLKGSVWDDVPAGSHATIINGSNDSILAIGGCALNIASYKFDEVNQEITKTKLFVKFTRNTTYRLREKSGSTTTFSAPIFAGKDEELIIDPPENDGDEIEIYIEQKERKTSRPIYVTQDHKGSKTTRTLQMESGQLYESPLCDFFNKQTLEYEFSESVSYQFTSETNYKINTEDEGTIDGDKENRNIDFTFTREESVTTTQAPGVSDTIERTKNVSSNYNSSYVYEKRNYYPPPGVGLKHLYTETMLENNVVSIVSSNEDGSDGPGIWTSTNTYTFERFWPTPSGEEPVITTNSGEGYNYDSGYSIGKRAWWDQFGISDSWGCVETSWSGEVELQEGTRTYNGTKSVVISVSEDEAYIVKSWYGSLSYSYNETSSGGGITWERSANGTYGGTESLVVRYEMVGEWEPPTTEPNEDFVVLKYKDPILEKEQNVNVDLELSFVAENSSEPITYEHWLHYYKKIDTNPTGNCVFVEVEAQNIKWTTTSTGGAESETRNITLAAPTEIAVGKIENLYYQVTKVVDEA